MMYFVDNNSDFVTSGLFGAPISYSSCKERSAWGDEENRVGWGVTTGIKSGCHFLPNDLLATHADSEVFSVNILTIMLSDYDLHNVVLTYWIFPSDVVSNSSHDERSVWINEEKCVLWRMWMRWNHRLLRVLYLVMEKLNYALYKRLKRFRGHWL